MREVNEMREMVKQLIHDPEKLSLFMTIWSQECHFYGFEMQLQGKGLGSFYCICN